MSTLSKHQVEEIRSIAKQETAPLGCGVYVIVLLMIFIDALFLEALQLLQPDILQRAWQSIWRLNP